MNAALGYERRYGRLPDVCLVSVSDGSEAALNRTLTIKTGGKAHRVMLSVSGKVRPRNYWLGVLPEARGDGVLKCRSCGAAIEWRAHEATGRKAPIEAEPNADGNVILVGYDRYRVASSPEEGPRYTNHFQVCPDRAAWRARGKGAKSV